jgi:two-component system response regulator MprA
MSIDRPKVLVVDDEFAVRSSLQRGLTLNGFDVDLAADGNAALDLLLSKAPDAVVLDVLMPELAGPEVCRRIRESGHEVPILMLTARDEVADRVSGLEAGADDYLTKPFALEELVARLRTLLRRRSRSSRAGRLAFADLTLDPSTRDVFRGQRPIELTDTEFRLLEFFLRNPRHVLSRSMLYERVWGYDFAMSSNTLDVFVGFLRRKTEAGGEVRLLHAVRGAGYVLRERQP